MKTTIYSVILASLLFLYSCEKDKFEQPPVFTKSSVITPNALGITSTFDLIAGQHHKAGTVTVWNTTDMLYIDVNTTNGWVLNKTHLYVGSLSSIPSNRGGNPQIGRFPYSENHNPNIESYQYSIPLSELSSCFIVALHAEVIKLDGTGKAIQFETAWGSGTRFTLNGSWATYGDYCIQTSSECEYETISYEIFGGQYISVGNLLVTNDATNLYVTYKTEGGWVLEEVHLYVGEYNGLPQNNLIPIPGQFPYSKSFNPYVNEYTITVPLAGLPSSYIIAAHSSVKLLDMSGNVISGETAWSYGTPFGGNRWGWYSNYTSQICF